ncbi:MAG: 1-deoxy-D-xylulose-5-phosphate reductoisomerase, partial [Pirellulaceae bacterium]
AHSLVEYRDGSTLAQLSPPDMKLPIQYALSYPERWEGPADQLDWSSPFTLDFIPPDPDRFPALEVGRQVARQGGTAGAVLNAANESAVAEFLEGRLEFIQIVPACRSVLEQHNFEPEPSLDRLVQLDQWARQEIKKWISQ